MTDTMLTRTDLLAALPPVWPEDPFPSIRRAVAESATKLVVLDDDPTGTQTVHGIPVLTTWSVCDLEAELKAAGPGFFILTNSRSLTGAAAAALNREIGANLRQASANTGTPVEVVSRSDSTLRGHFPGEVDALMEAMGTGDLPRILVPCFFEGGRYTVNDIHYVAEGEHLVPAAQTPYARDAAFGYRHSNLREWVQEKTEGAVTGNTVVSVSIEDVRKGGPNRVADRLATLSPGSCCIVNAMEYRDLEVFVAGLLAAVADRDRRFVFRTAASLVRIRAGIMQRDLLDRTELTVENGSGGLFVVGSYVPKTSDQPAVLRSQESMVGIEVNVNDLLDDARQPLAVADATAAANEAMKRGRDAVLFTSRDLVAGADARGSLDIGRRVSESLIAVVRGISRQPRYLVAKGGITSSDVATKGLGVRRAMIMGQVLPGIPAWQLGRETRWPGMAYIVFPGNVGDDDALAVIRRRLAGPRVYQPRAG
jgi:uncharacterized protein YgbK (DUF1537 family)